MSLADVKTEAKKLAALQQGHGTEMITQNPLHTTSSSTAQSSEDLDDRHPVFEPDDTGQDYSNETAGGMLSIIA